MTTDITVNNVMKFHGKLFYRTAALFTFFLIYSQASPALAKKSDGARIIKIAIEEKSAVLAKLNDSDKKQFKNDITQLSSKGSVKFSQSTYRRFKQYEPLFQLIEKATTADYFEFHQPKKRTLDESFFNEAEYEQFSNIIFFPRLFIPLNEKKYLDIVNLYTKSNRILFSYYSQGGLLDFLKTFSGLEIEKVRIVVYAIDKLSQSEALQALKFYAQVYPLFPSFTDILKNEEQMWINTIERSLKNAEQGENKRREKIVAIFEKKGSDPIEIAKIKSGKLLSIASWRQQSCSVIHKEFNFMMQKFDTYNIKEYQNIDKEQQARAAAIYGKTTKDYATALENILTIIAGENITITKAAETWNKLGTGIANTFWVQLLSISETQIKFGHLLYATLNRLIFIRLARKALGHETTTPLKDIIKAGLVPEAVLIDPFSGKRFRSLKNKSGKIIIYSVYNNQLDNQGNDDDLALDYLKINF